MIIGTFTKQPSEVLDYRIDLSQWLTEVDYAVGMTTKFDEGITIDSTIITDSGKSIVVWVSGGVSGKKYKIQVIFNTNDGRTKEFEFVVKVKEY